VNTRQIDTSTACEILSAVGAGGMGEDSETLPGLDERRHLAEDSPVWRRAGTNDLKRRIGIFEKANRSVHVLSWT